MTKARDLFRAFFLVTSRELSLFLLRVLLRVNRVPVFLVGRGDRFLAFTPAILPRRPRSWIRLHLECFCPSRRPRTDQLPYPYCQNEPRIRALSTVFPVHQNREFSERKQGERGRLLRRPHHFSDDFSTFKGPSASDAVNGSAICR